MLRRAKGAVVFLANLLVGVLSYSAPFRPAALPCAAAPRPVLGMSEFLIRQVLDISVGLSAWRSIWRLRSVLPWSNGNLSNPLPGLTTGGSRRSGTRRDGEARRRLAGRDANDPVRPGGNRPSYFPDDRRKLSWVRFRKYEQEKLYVNRWRNKNRGWRSIYPRLIPSFFAGRNALFVPGLDQCTDAYLSLQTFFIQGMSGNIFLLCVVFFSDQ